MSSEPAPDREAKQAGRHTRQREKTARLHGQIQIPAAVFFQAYADKTVTDIKPNSSQLEKPPSNRLSTDPPVKAKPFVQKDSIQMPGMREGSSQQKTADLDATRESLREELNTLLLQKGDLEAELKMLLQKNRKPDTYGIYIVQRNDNIWNIHFKFLTEYFRNREIEISRQADEPDQEEDRS